MLFAVVSDLHGNPAAMEAVWRELEDAKRIFCLGDVVGIGPRPETVMDMLMEDRRVERVIGNHDHNTLHGTELGPTDAVPRRPHHDWVRERLSEDQRRFLGSPMSIRRRIGGVDFHFMHCHPENCGAAVPYFESPFANVVEDFYSGVEGDVLFFGHTHVPLDLTGASGRRYINPGAVGVENRGQASYVLVEAERGEAQIERKTALYDSGAVRRELIEKKVPYADFIVRNFFK